LLKLCYLGVAMPYYDENLAGERLRLCYEIASPRVRRYLKAEIAHVASLVSPGRRLLELGCGYGRICFELANSGAVITGIDSAGESIALARKLAGADSPLSFHERNALRIGFPADSFDLVLCLQNGICAFGVDQKALLREALRVCRPGAKLVFSSYAAIFWPHRLEWFKAQAEAGLLGPIDHEATGDGVIVCKDGFRAGAYGPEEFLALGEGLGLRSEIHLVDDSALFCIYSRS
jgi:SAM-dependent methyltransferase